MKKIVFTFLSSIILLTTAHAQKGIDFNKNIAAGGRLLMSVDSSAKNVVYAVVFPNQPNTSFNYLPEVNNLNIQINFRKNINIQHYRYTILVDDKPIAVNKSIDMAQLKDTHAGGDAEIFSTASLGTFVIKGKIITTLVYSIDKPQDIDKSVFYGKLLPKAKIKAFGRRFKTEKGVDYKYIVDPKEHTKLSVNSNDDELTIVKDKSDIDYIYSISIIDKQANKIIFESNVWQYGGLVTENHEFAPYVKIDRNVFKKSGDYEVIIQPSIKWNSCPNCDFSKKEIENYAAKYMLSITIDEESYTKKELYSYTIIATFIIGLNFLLILNAVKKRSKKKLEEVEQKRNTAKLQLSTVRSQLNPHFLFNALAGIQNLMNKNEIDNANKYLSKFARLTRNVLDDKELISLSQEKTLLDDYLQMEQLRFGFTYEINCAENLYNIEIPSMLLQPFVENAVKHGISQKATEGKIIITLIKQTYNLVLTVADNGIGFDTEKRYIGLGLTLSESRIALLNNIYKENRFILGIQSTNNGTKISLTLTDWLQ